MKRALVALRNIFITKTPIYVIFFVSSLCNARCKMCFNWRRIDGASMVEELTLDEIKKIFSHFSDIQQLTISGGEPYLREDLADILEFVSHKNNVQMITIPSNGILTDRIYRQVGNILERIKPDTHLRAGLSIEGIGKKHDEVVGVDGAFEKIQETYQKLRTFLGTYKNFNIDISICCSAFNKKDLKDIIRYCVDYFKDCSIELLLARGDTRDGLSKIVTAEEYQEILDYLHKLKNSEKINKPFARLINVSEKIIREQVVKILKTKRMPSRCYAYSKMVILQSNGDLFPCEYLDKRLGNLREYNYDVKEILGEEKNKMIEKFIRDGNCFCTWECALINNIACNPKMYFRVLKELVTNYSKQ